MFACKGMSVWIHISYYLLPTLLICFTAFMHDLPGRLLFPTAPSVCVKCAGLSVNSVLLQPSRGPRAEQQCVVKYLCDLVLRMQIS